MIIGISGRAGNLILAGKADEIPNEYVKYDTTDTGFKFSKYDSNVATQWKKGADVLPLGQVQVQAQEVIKDIPFKAPTEKSTGKKKPGSE